MNLNLNYKGFEKYLKESYTAHPMILRGPSDGIHYIFRFENGYGASVVKNLLIIEMSNKLKFEES